MTSSTWRAGGTGQQLRQALQDARERKALGPFHHRLIARFLDDGRVDAATPEENAGWLGESMRAYLLDMNDALEWWTT